MHLARTHEEIVGLRTGPADLEELHHVPELAVYVAAYLSGAGCHSGRPEWAERGRREETYCDGGVYDLNVSLFDEDLAGFEAEAFDLLL